MVLHVYTSLVSTFLSSENKQAIVVVTPLFNNNLEPVNDLPTEPPQSTNPTHTHLISSSYCGSVIGIIRSFILDNMDISWFIRLVKK